MDENRQLVPVGLPGELYIGGKGLARGYHNRPELTSEAFIRHPFRPSSGERLYRTGDLVRYQRDGSMQLIGRIDYQVKLRGFRIELGEIENVLEEHPAVRIAVAKILDGASGDKQLVAYLVWENTEVPLDTLRAFLRQYLPEYMLPSFFVTLESLPVTLNGKVDRKALPAPAWKHYNQAAYLAPRDYLELQLVRIWEEILQVRPIGITDPFFQLGGHSLLTVRMMAEIQRRLNKKLPVSAIFQGETIERLAGMLRSNDMPLEDSRIVELQKPKQTDRKPIFFLHPAGGNVHCYVPLAYLLGEDQPVYAVQSPSLVNNQLPYPDFISRAKHYAKEIQSVQPEGPYRLGGWCYGGVVAFAVAQELKREGQEVDHLILMDSFVPRRISKEEEPDRAEIVQSFSVNLEWDYTENQQSLDRLRAMSDEEHIDYLVELAGKGSDVSMDASYEQLQDALHLWMANLQLVWKYQPEMYAGRLTCIQPAEKGVDMTGWNRWASEGAQFFRGKGNHYTMIRPPHLQPLAEQIRSILAQ
ncbi:hypothetical protein CEN49_25260 [Fischerella thermalis CCMEE 5273]|nr:hypothetical protein CEN49_25260 [Fischerella thermalis CCMEE 5273]